MSSYAPENGLDRLEELLMDEALIGLSPAQSTELDRLLLGHPQVDRDEYGLAIAAFELAMPRSPAKLSQTLTDQILDGFSAAISPKRPVAGAVGSIAPPSVPARSSSTLWNYAGWFVAALSLMLALFLTNRQAPKPAQPQVLTAAEQRQQLLEEASDLETIKWAKWKDESGALVEGDVVWSNSAQKGFMRFRGLAKNDARQEQYQLWIIDAQRPGSAPVDGGVFDIASSDGEVIVPIDAKLKVFQPAAFAVTIEKPGGVVVSDQSRAIVIAAAGA